MDAEARKAELMKENKLGDGKMFKMDFDPRVIGNKVLPDGSHKTGVGDFIRRTSLDEFPQFFNVLKGDMSIVGTRPPLISETNLYEPHHKVRLAIKPGITGMWQVSGRSDITDFEEVVRFPGVVYIPSGFIELNYDDCLEIGYNGLMSKGYTEKQWGRACRDLPAFIIKRLPVRFTFDNNYFNALYQGIPIGGYTKMIENILNGIEVKCNEDYLEKRNYWNNLAKKIVYTGPIDAFYEYKLGTLEYRSVRFENEILDKINFQGNAAVNYTDKETPWTRIIEHKWFEFGKDENGNIIPKTIISREYSSEWIPGDKSSAV